MTVCLQGGGEFSVGCRTMDADLVRRAEGRIVVTALAGAVGRDYATATANGVRHLRAVGGADVVGAPDAREDPDGAARVVASARLLVLPGGSPSRLLAALRETSVGDLAGALLEDGGTLMGSSAGAMVLCPWTVLPDKRGAAGLVVEAGLGLVPGVAVVPHWSGGSSRGDWLRALAAAVPAGTQVLGIPEESGVWAADGVLTAVGQAPTRLVTGGLDLEIGHSWRLP